ncbi:MAG: tetratricopeptide repeat protein [Chthoniobacteraceae bacterium]
MRTFFQLIPLLLFLALPAFADPTPTPEPAASATPEPSATPTPLPAPAAPNWAVYDAPYRIALKLKAAPQLPEAGIEINLPELGLTRPDLADALLTDKDGKPQPLARLGLRPGSRILLLAQTLTADTPYYLYFGGTQPRTSLTWSPKVSLLMETRPAPKDLKFDSLQSLKTAWTQSPEPPGAGFVPVIYHGGNPFGPNANYLTRYTGYLNLPAARDLTFYTLSSDCSFVVVNGQADFGWPGQHGAYAEPKNVVKKTVACPQGLVKIEYYAAKGPNDSEARLGAATVLGWQKPDTTFEAIPQDAWVHPGTSNYGALQTRENRFIPTPRASVETFCAHNGLWFYETKFALSIPQAVKTGTATWEFPDGATVTGTAFSRLLVGADSQTVRCKWTADGATVSLPLRIDIPERLQRASINSAPELRRYLDRINEEAAYKIKPEAARPRLAFLADFGTDAEIARYAEQVPRENDADPLWFSAQLARIRTQAETDAPAARQALGTLLQTFQPATVTQFGAQIAATEMDLLVYVLRDPSAFGRLDQLAFINRADADLTRTVKIRIGDLHRLLGHTKEAIDQYQGLTPPKKDPALAVKDSAASLAIRDLLATGFIREAQAKLLEWERRRPMTKYDSDFLLLRARVWIEMGRWAEAKTELESFQKLQPDHPFQLDAQFYLARILFEQGQKDEARKIWTAFAAAYPRHPLAAEAKTWAAKP